MRTAFADVIFLMVLLAGSVSAWAAAPGRSEQGTYLVLSAGDTLATESFTRDAHDVSGRMTAGGQVLQDYHWSIGPRASIHALQLTMRPGPLPGDSAAMHIFVHRNAQGMVVTFRDSTMRIDNTFEYGEVVQVGVAGSVVFLEQMVRHARALGQSRVRVPIFLPATREQWLASITTLGADSTRVDLSGDAWRLAVDAEGRILGGVTESSGIRLGRLAKPGAAKKR